MYSTRKTTKLAATLLLATAAIAGPLGCSQAPAPTQTVTALPVDEAMQHRKWSTATAEYANGSVVAYSRRELIPFPLHTHYLRLTGDSVAFLINSAWTPITLAFDPIMGPVTYRGYVTAPSATAVPPLESDEIATPEATPDKADFPMAK